MGTGDVSILFYVFPYGFGTRGMAAMSLVFFFFNLVIFCIFSAFTIARYVMYPKSWFAMIRDPGASLYLSCIPMGAATIISVAVQVICVHYDFGGKGFLYFCWGMWWIDVFVSGLCFWGLVHVMITRQKHALETMTGAWLFPIVTLIVSGSTGGICAKALIKYSVSRAIVTAGASAFLVILSFFLSFGLMIIYMLRLIVHGIPPGPQLLSAFLTFGLSGQGGFAVVLIGQAFGSVIPYPHGSSAFLHSETTGNIIYVLCIVFGFGVWSIATMFIIYTALALYENVRAARFPVKLPFMGLIFPVGAYANLTLNLAPILDSRFFRIYGAIWAVFTLLIWIYVGGSILLQVFNRSAFMGPPPPAPAKAVEDVEKRNNPSPQSTIAP